MISIRVSVLARYLLASPADQVEILQDQKYPPRHLLGMLRFHNPARQAIVSFHRGTLSLEELEGEAIALRAKAENAVDSIEKAELISNAAIIEHWVAQQVQRRLMLSGDQTFELRRKDVEITAKPNMIAREHGERRLLFFAFGKQCTAQYARMLAELAYEVVLPWVRDLKPAEIEIVDREGKVSKIKRRSSRLSRDIEFACNEISKAWPTIQPPPGRSIDERRDDPQLAIDFHPA